MIIYLYVKQHSITGLKYFGKTEKSNPFKYLGSGKRWCRHINKHGKDHVKTIELWGFDSQELCTEFAIKFSNDNNIVESDEWANIIPENGLDGAPKGNIRTIETREKLSESLKGKKAWNKGLKMCDEQKIKISNSKIGHIRSNESRIKQSISSKGRKSANLNKVWITKGSKESNILVPKHSIDSYISNGYFIGRILK